MRILQHRIRNLSAHLPPTLIGKQIRVISDDIESHRKRLIEIGFPEPFEAGISVLPSKSIGPQSRFNAEGRLVPNRQLPKEMAIRPHYWTRTEYRGRDRVEISDVVFISYKRYPRDFITPPEIRMVLGNTSDGHKVVTSGSFTYGTDDDLLLAAINLYLECFGHCIIADDDGTPVKTSTIRRLDWDLLPPGKYPWQQLREHLSRSFTTEKPNSKSVIYQRLEILNSYKPTFHAVGRSGFSGYVVLGFEELGVYILECQRQDNATYVFGSDWETLSQLTKRDILIGNLQLQRLIHGPYWQSQVEALLGGKSDDQRLLDHRLTT